MGFNRSLWDRIAPLADEIANSTGLDCLPGAKFCVHSLEDWSFAVSRENTSNLPTTYLPGGFMNGCLWLKGVCAFATIARTIPTSEDLEY